MPRRRHILVVDDEPDLVRALSIRLQAAGYRVSAAADGMGAVQAVLQERPDLVVLDLVLPNLDGHAVLQRLQGLEGGPLPVLCLSARTAADDQERAWAAGASAYLTKPFDGAALLSAVEELVAGLDGAR